MNPYIDDPHEEIKERFFRAVKRIADRQYGGSMRQFEQANELNHGNFSQLKDGAAKVQIWHIRMVVEKYHVSADWIFLCAGRMFQKGYNKGVGLYGKPTNDKTTE